MKTTDQFLDDIRARHHLRFDHDVAAMLGWKSQQISRYRQRINTFDDDTCIKVAQALDVEPAYVAACMSAQRARTPEARAMWERAAVRIAACILAGVALAVDIEPTEAAGLHNQNPRASEIHISALFRFLACFRAWALRVGSCARRALSSPVYP